MTSSHDHKMKGKGIDILDGDVNKFGEGDNHLEINKTTGQMKLKGTAAVWKDMIADLFGAKLESEAGGVTYDYEEGTLVFGPGGDIDTAADRVGGNLEINHEFAIGEGISFYPHIHWFQTADLPYTLTIRYRLQRNGEAKETDWIEFDLVAGTTAGNDIYPYVSGTLNQLTSASAIEVLTEVGISDTIQFQLARTDSEAGDMAVIFLDLHGKVDSLGSDGVTSKS